MLIRAKPLAAICWLVQPGHPPASTWAMSQHQSPMHPTSSMGLRLILLGQVTGGTGMLTVFRPRSLQMGRTLAHVAQSRLHL